MPWRVQWTPNTPNPPTPNRPRSYSHLRLAARRPTPPVRLRTVATAPRFLLAVRPSSARPHGACPPSTVRHGSKRSLRYSAPRPGDPCAPPHRALEIPAVAADLVRRRQAGPELERGSSSSSTASPPLLFVGKLVIVG